MNNLDYLLPQPPGDSMTMLWGTVTADGTAVLLDGDTVPLPTSTPTLVPLRANVRVAVDRYGKGLRIVGEVSPPPTPLLQMHLDTGFAIPGSSTTWIVFSAADPNSDTNLDNGGTHQWFSAPVAGWYAIDATVIFQNTGSGAADTRAVDWSIYRGGAFVTIEAAAMPAAVAANHTTVHASDVIWLNAGELLSVIAWSNIALNLLPGTRVSMRWVRA